MSGIKKLFATTLTMGIIGASAAATDADPLRAMLDDSRSQQKGLMFIVGGQQIPGVVVDITDKFVIARSQAQGRIVIRLDRIDGASGFVGEKK